MKPKKLTFACATCIFFLIIIYSIVIIFLGDRPGGQVLFASQQPPNIHYESFDPYIFKIIQGSIKWNTIGWPRRTIIMIMRNKDDSYGHFIETDLFQKGDKISVFWTNNAIEVIFPLGHKLIIPKKVFIGGR
ncbi:MAG: hypothetical protein HZB23_05990 [Deltaproteobacteria bacterium]|nr:hypothetical protein [Deltaproteobacteria bacterium]